jgi:eukaryotic-like serine/threonine-protein kinase
MNLFTPATRLFCVNVSVSLTDSLIRLGLLAEDDAGLAHRLERSSFGERHFLAELHRRGKLTRLQTIQAGRGRAHHLAVGPYLLMDRLGSGGMGRVFLARHRNLNRLAAVKLVRLDRRHCPATRGRFLREVRLVSRLNHENVVHAHDAGVAHGSLYLAMEYVPGPDLSRVLLSQGAFEPGPACEYARQAALGLQHIHDRGLIHRDIKPANLGLSANFHTVKVLDVGLARRNRSNWNDSGLSQARRLIGSPDYASPEQVVDSRRVDPRADLYALGCSLYHMLAGRVPFPGGTPVAKAMKHLSESPTPIDELRADLPNGLSEVLARLMARRRTHRFRTAEDAAAALAPFATPFVTGTPVGDTAPYSLASADCPTLVNAV